MRKGYNENLPSVTQVLDVLRKAGLEYWFKNNTPEFIKKESEKGKGIGTLIHSVIQSHIERSVFEIETEYPQEVSSALRSFFLFKKENPHLKLKRSEVSLVVKKYGYNMTLDCLAEDNGQIVLLDWKTGNAKEKGCPPIHAEHLYQASAYVVGYNVSEKANIKTAHIVSLAKDKVAYGHKIIDEKDIQSCFKQVFLPCLKIWKFQHKK